MPFELRGATAFLQVYDMPTSIRFYRDLLGFSIITTSPPLGGEDRFHWVWLRRNASAWIPPLRRFQYSRERRLSIVR